jgi:hypothetical protein
MSSDRGSGAASGSLQGHSQRLDKRETPSREDDFLQRHGTPGRRENASLSRPYPSGWHYPRTIPQHYPGEGFFQDASAAVPRFVRNLLLSSNSILHHLPQEIQHFQFRREMRLYGAIPQESGGAL